MGLIHEKIFKELHKRYKSAYFSVLDAVCTVGTFGEKEDKLKLVETVTQGDRKRFLSDEDKELIKMLEYLLDDTEPVKK